MAKLRRFLIFFLLLLPVLLPLTAQAKTFKQGDKDWKVKVAQEKLIVLGYQKGKAENLLTAGCAAALKRFQKDYKLKASGELDDKTYSSLTWQAFAQKGGIKGVKGGDVAATAAKLKGVPYKFGGTTVKAFDCSGYVQYVFKQHKAALPRLADAQAQEGVFVTQRQLKPGDLVFFTTYEEGASHVGIAAGGKKFWHVSTSKGVMLSSLNDVYWKPRYWGARRVLVANGQPK